MYLIILFWKIAFKNCDLFSLDHCKQRDFDSIWSIVRQINDSSCLFSGYQLETIKNMYQAAVKFNRAGNRQLSKHKFVSKVSEAEKEWLSEEIKIKVCRRPGASKKIF